MHMHIGHSMTNDEWTVVTELGTVSFAQVQASSVSERLVFETAL